MAYDEITAAIQGIRSRLDTLASINGYVGQLSNLFNIE